MADAGHGGNRPPIALIGAPSDAGAGERGSSMGPEALRVAGIAAALQQLGYAVEDCGNLAGPANPNAAPVDGYRHLDEVATWCRGVRDAVGAALARSQVPILMGGDHSLAVGSIAGAAAHCAAQEVPLSVLWLDAHADFNTPQTTPSGNLHGMPLAVLAGLGPPEVCSLGPATPLLVSARTVLFGVRSVDRLERPLLAKSGIEVVDMRRIDEDGMRAALQGVLDRMGARGGHLHVSLDVDFLDPSIAPGVPTTVPGGPTYREAQLCMEMIYDSGLMKSLDIVELSPAHDHRNQTADLVVDLVESLFGQQILSRTRTEL